MPSRRKSQKHSAQKRAQQRQTVRDLGAMVAKEFRNLSAQWHAAMSLHTYLTTGKRMGPLQGWPISPDLGLLLIDLVESGHYQAIIEFGSGTSTMLMATANRNGPDGPNGQQPIPQLAFEHLTDFHAQTCQLLRANGLEGIATVVHAPLAPIELDGITYNYYDCQATLAEFAGKLDLHAAHKRVLVLVDGPPGATNPLARYPALHWLLEHLGGVGLDLLMDDMVREDEQTIVSRWKDELQRRGRSFSERHYAFEKGALMLFVQPDERLSETAPR